MSPAERTRVFEQRWRFGSLTALSSAYTDLAVDREANDTAAEFIRAKIRKTVRPRVTAEALCPRYPFGPSVLSNMVVSIEQHVDWIADCIGWLRAAKLTTIEADRRAEDAWTDHVRAAADQTLYPHTDSWYLGTNVPGKPRVFLPYYGGVGNYRSLCDRVAADGYRGFRASRL